MADGGTPQNHLELTESCAKRIAAIRQMEGDDGLMLRITVSGGGCSGFQYGFNLDGTINDDDLTFEREGTRIVVDEVSLGLLEGSVVDFKEDLGGSYFVIENPNATSSCGCGASFSI